MINIILADGRKNFLEEVRNRIAVRDDGNVAIECTMTNLDQLRNKYSKYVTAALVCSNIAEKLEDMSMAGMNVIGYSLKPDDEKIFEKMGIPSIGVIKNGAHLLKTLEKPLPKASETKKEQEEPQNVDEPEEAEQEEKPRKAPAKKMDTSSDQSTNADTKNIDDVSFEEFQEYLKFKRMMMLQKEQAKQGMIEETDSPGEDYEEPEDDEREEEKPKHGDRKKDSKEKPANKKKEEKAKRDKDEDEDSKKPVKKLRPSERDSRKDEEEVERDLMPKKEKTKVVTVYAAKGGVGKTTIATEIATYLALTSHARGTYKVCIVDYNIDFGDVRATLGLSDDAIGMYEWALDIRDMIEEGTDPDDIKFSSKEMDRYLQTVKKTGLAALCAPIKHEESQDIGRSELEVMLRNIIENGGYDFVVCDTGNNTRDSSMYALIYADTILMIATQDVTTATCNSSVIDALDAFGMDLSRIKLIINNAMSAKSTGIPVQEVVDAFPYEHIATIKHNTDIIKANNLSKPIVYQANHPVTKELQKIIAYLTGQEVEKPKKSRGFFGRKK